MCDLLTFNDSVLFDEFRYIDFLFVILSLSSVIKGVSKNKGGIVPL